MKETMKFQAESKELLNLMINSIYSNKDIFLRELISNASDAIDKYKFKSLNSEGKIPSKDYKIDIILDKKNNKITIKDNGIGMSKEDLTNNLGTIAKSGSKDFVAKFKEAKESKDFNIIGQFGVGFYSAFMVAQEVEVLTKTIDDKAYLFTSDGVDTYSIEESEREDTGTTITLTLKKDKDGEEYSKYLETYEIENLVKKYSDYIRYPIKMDVKTSKPKVDKDGKPIEGKYDEVVENKTLNSMIPLWKKNKKDVTEEELNSFYKDKFNDYEDPLASLFISVEGLVSYNALVYIPSHAPYNLYSENYEKGLDLYAKGVFIKEKCKELVPDYLKFVKGVVDSDDFSLNISREILQSNPVINKIANNIENKVVAKLNEIKKEDFDKYLKFFKEFGDHIKYGIYSSYGTKKDLLQDLLVFDSLKEDKKISLKDYKDKMPKDQKYIYFASGKSKESILMLPQIEKYKKGDQDVLLLSANIDEFCILMMRDYDKVEFKSISEDNKEEVSKEEKEKIESCTAQNKELIDDIKDALKDEVNEVVLSSKLVDSPVCISTKDGLSLNMEDVMSKQPGVDENEAPKAQKVLEINPEHELFKALQALKGDKDKVKKYASLLYEEAMLLEGFDIKNRTEFVKNLNELMVESLKK